MNKTRMLFATAAAAAALVVALAVVHTDHSSARSTRQGVSLKTRSSSFGRILVDGGGRTLYLFEKDRPGRSSCGGLCATYWPPLIVHGAPKAGAGISAALLRTTRRSDGSRQLTYAGHPLYRFSGDQAPGQATGQGMNAFGAEWYVVSRSGNKIERGGES